MPILTPLVILPRPSAGLVQPVFAQSMQIFAKTPTGKTIRLDIELSSRFSTLPASSYRAAERSPTTTSSKKARCVSS